MKKLKRRNIITIIFIIITILLAIILDITNQANVFLGCGVFAFVGKSAKDFSWQIFNILGLYNDDRGGDSCGRVIGNTVEKGINKMSEYEDLVKESDDPEETNNIVLGHTRKASIGDKTLANAQPIILKKSYRVIRKRAKKDKKYEKWINSLQRNSIVFAGIHNGTIHNYKELAKKYHISLFYSDKDEKSDSQILFEILAKGHKEVLSEYYGTAAIIFHCYYENKTYVFKGESSFSDASTSYTSEEKPLYVWDTKRNGFYFSSVRSPLDFMGTTKADISDVASNILIGMSKGKIISREKVDRDDKYQRKPTSNGSRNTGNYCHPHNRCSHNRFDGPYNGLASDYGNFPIKNEDISSLDRHSLFFAEKNSMKWNTEIMSKISSDEASKSTESTKRLFRIQYRRGRYWLNNVILQGLVITSRAGYLIGHNEYTIAGVVNYFVDGLLMKSRESFFEALAERLKKTGTKNSTSKYFDVLRQHSRYPFCDLSSKRNDVLSPSHKGTKWYTGSFQPFYSNREYHFNTGNLTSITLKHDGINTNKDGEVFYKDLKRVIKFYRNNFAPKLAEEIQLKDCQNSDPVNRVLIEILESAETDNKRYLISKEVSNITSNWKSNRDDDDEAPEPDVDLKKVKEAVIASTDVKEIREIIVGAHPCEHCIEDPNSCEYKIKCKPLQEYGALCKQFLINNENTSEDQLANDHIRKITTKLLKNIDDTESEISIIGEEEKSSKMVAKLQEIKDILCEETE